MAGDPVLAARVRRERLPWTMPGCNATTRCVARLDAAAANSLAPKDPGALCAEFIGLAEKLHAGQFAEGRSFSEYAKSLRRNFRPAAPVPELCKGLGENDWFDVQDNRFRLARPGQWISIVDDPRASDKMAARCPAAITNGPSATRFPRT